MEGRLGQGGSTPQAVEQGDGEESETETESISTTHNIVNSRIGDRFTVG